MSRTWRTLSTKPGALNWRADTFTLTYRPRGTRRRRPVAGVAARSRRHRAMSEAAWASTQEPSGTIWPVSSARAMNWSGCIIPHCGCGHRTSASNPASSPLVSVTIGW